MDLLDTIPLSGPGSESVDEFGCQWWLSAISGWESADASSATVDRPAADGATWTTAWLSPRAIGIDEAWLIAPDYQSRVAAEDRLRRALPHDRAITMTLGGRSAQVRRSARLLVERTSETTVKWSVGLVAADPRLYGATLSDSCGLPSSTGGAHYPLHYPLHWADVVSGALAVSNDGDAPTPVVAVFAGPVTNPLMLDERTGRVLEFDLAIASGDALVVDTLAGTALLGGADRVGYATSRSDPIEAFLLEPGDSTVAFRAASGAGTLTMSWASAYLGG